MSLSQPSDAGAERRVLKESNDYFTQAEYVTFKGKDKDKYNSKTSKDKDKDKSKKRKIRVKNEEEDDTGENQNKERGIGKGLEQSLAEQQQYQNHHIEQYESSTADYGSRREKHKSARTSTGMGEEDKVGNDAKEATDRLASYRHAVKTAGEKSARAFATTNSSLEVALEPELAVSFARAQRLQATSNTVDKGASWVIQQAQVQRSKASAVINDEDVVMKGTGTVIDMPDEEGRCADGKLVFTSSTVFSHKMRAMEDEKSLQRAQRIEQTQTQTQTIKVENSGTADVDMNDEQEHAYDDEQEQEQVGEKHISHTPVSAIELQPLASSSMAAALNLLKGSGDLSQTDSRLAGRAKDARKQDPAARDFDVKIDYHDEFGRKLTQKEAFRQLNYRFHGIAPGLKAQEKRLRTLEREAQHANTGMMGENTGAMQNLLHVQKATGSAHVTVSSSYKNTTGQRDESVAQLALDIHNKRIAHKEKKQQQMLNNLNTAVSSSSSSTKL